MDTGQDSNEKNDQKAVSQTHAKAEGANNTRCKPKIISTFHTCTEAPNRTLTGAYGRRQHIDVLNRVYLFSVPMELAEHLEFRLHN
jgi:hypothetical protein